MRCELPEANDRIADFLKNGNRFAFFLGAGASFCAGAPTGAMIIEELKADLSTGSTEETLGTLTNSTAGSPLKRGFVWNLQNTPLFSDRAFPIRGYAANTSSENLLTADRRLAILAWLIYWARRKPVPS
jgi:hypothetical protein